MSKRLLRPLPRLPEIGPARFRHYSRPKSDKSDFGWRAGEGEAACSVLVASPSPPSPHAGEEAQAQCRVQR
jgi:hypothetical protein